MQRKGWTPALVTVRVLRGIPSLRSEMFVQAMRWSFARACERPDFRLVHFPIQTDHIHMIVEADSQDALGRGMKSLCSRIARAVHRVFHREGRVVAGRYHARWVNSPRQAYNALRYVLLNARKHYVRNHGVAPPARLDEASSGRAFDGWAGGAAAAAPTDTALPRTWLIRTGWRRHGLINPADVPGS